MARRVPTVLCLALLLLQPAAGSAASSSPPGPDQNRLYLLGAETNYLYWGVDPTDPELGARTITRRCGPTEPWGVPERSRPCLAGLIGATRIFSVFFFPGSLVEAPITWNAAAPLRFRVVADVEAGGAPFTLHFLIQSGAATIESPPATQVSPGVWEGTISSGSPLDTTAVTFLSLRVRTAGISASFAIRGAGASYLELPNPVPARSVPQLLDESTYRPSPTSLQTATRTFRFNDGDWNVRSFRGELGETRRFDLALESDAVALIAWVEAYDTPFLHDVIRGGPADRRKLLQGASLDLYRDGELITHSGLGDPYGGSGTEALAVPYLASGPLTLEVTSASEEEEDRQPFTAYILEVRGERTLRSMRWTFLQDTSFRVPLVAACPGSPEVIPVTDEVRTFSVDVDWDTEAIGVPGWSVRFALPGVGSFPCSEGGTGDRVRLTVPGTRVWYVGATPAYDRTYISAYDTVFEMTVDYTYTPPPPPV